jgi:hypothetical protein
MSEATSRPRAARATRAKARSSSTSGSEQPRERVPGAVEAAVLEELRAAGEHGRPGLAAAALVLARHLDDGAGLTTAAVARELRATLDDVTRDDVSVQEGVVSDLLRTLSTPVRDPA